MIIELKDVTEQQVEQISERLQNDGYRYDEDFTCLYGAQWKLVGLRFMGHPVAVQRAVAVATDMLVVMNAARPREFTLPKFGHDYIR